MEEEAETLFGMEFEEDEAAEAFMLPVHICEKFNITNEEYQTTVKVLEAFKGQAEVLQDSFFKAFRSLGINVFLKSTTSEFYGGLESREKYTRRKERK